MDDNSNPRDQDRDSWDYGDEFRVDANTVDIVFPHVDENFSLELDGSGNWDW